VEAGTPDGESNEKEKVEEMEKDAFETRYISEVHHFNVHCYDCCCCCSCMERTA